MDNYLNTFREMLSLPGLSEHTQKGCSADIRTYLDCMQQMLHKSSEDVSWQQLKTTHPGSFIIHRRLLFLS